MSVLDKDCKEVDLDGRPGETLCILIKHKEEIFKVSIQRVPYQQIEDRGFQQNMSAYKQVWE